MEIKISLFEDNDQLRHSLVMLLNNSSDYKVIGDYHDCTQADFFVLRDEPDIVIMDIDLPLASGIDGVRMIKETRPQTYVIMYTMFEDDDKLFKSLCAGANGYILKQTSPEKLFEAIRDVMTGGAPMSPSVAKKVLNSFQTRIKATDYHLSEKSSKL